VACWATPDALATPRRLATTHARPLSSLSVEERGQQILSLRRHDMKLLTEELRKKLPPLYSNEHVDDPLAIVKFFHPLSNWTWFVLYAELGINPLMPSAGLCRAGRVSSCETTLVNSA
jgi:hypothetical protein